MEKIAEVIKYEGDNNIFVWKHPCEDFNSLTQLIVHESQEALFFMDGKALDLFGAGEHTLETKNVPKIGKFFNRLVGDQTPFHCEVYFINKTEQMAIKWGTDTKVQYVDPIYGFPISIGAGGELSLRAEDSRKLVLKLVGTEKNLTQSALVDKIRSILMVTVKSYIARVIKEQKINIFEIDEKLAEFSTTLKEMLLEDFANYGLALEQFLVTRIVKPDGDKQYEKFKELHFRQYADITEAKLRQQTDLIYAETEAQKTIIESKAIATKRSQEGYTYQQERSFDVAHDVARNEAVAQFTNLGVGLGTMAGIGGAVGGILGGAIGESVHATQEQVTLTQSASLQASELPTAEEILCPNCQIKLPIGAKFCFGCGNKIEAAVDSDMITCPNCGKKVKKGRFCLECGQKLVNVCPSCNCEIPEEAKFCFKCGQKI